MNMDIPAQAKINPYYKILKEICLSNINTLRQYTELGIALAARNDYNALIENEFSQRYTNDFSKIEAMANGKHNFISTTFPKGTPVKRFSFVPAKHGFICFDIDNKNGVNGIEALKEFAKEKGLDLKNTFNKTAFVKTPNKGFHFYFKCRYTGKLKKDLCRGVEIKSNLDLTAGGSIKDGKPYILKGKLAEALELPKEFLELCKAQIYEMPKQAIYTGKEKKYSLDFFLNETLEQVQGNHNRQLTFSRKCKTFSFLPEQVLEFIYKHPEHFGTGKDTANTVYSIYGMQNPNRGGI